MPWRCCPWQIKFTEDPTGGATSGNISNHDIIARLIKTYGCLTQREIEENKKQLLKPFQQTPPIENLIHRFKKVNLTASWNNANKIANQQLTHSFIAHLEECPKYNKAFEEWNAFEENQQTWARAQSHFQEASQKIQQHAQQTADSQGYGNAFNAQTGDNNSIASTIADMNVNHEEILEAFSELSQSTHATEAKNLQLEQEIAALQAQLAQSNIHSANTTMAPPLKTLQTVFQKQPSM